MGKDGSTGHDGFFKATCQQKSVKKLGRNGQRWKKGRGRVGLPSTGAELQRGEGTGLAAEPEIPREDASSSLAHAERLSSNKMT